MSDQCDHVMKVLALDLDLDLICPCVSYRAPFYVCFKLTLPTGALCGSLCHCVSLCPPRYIVYNMINAELMGKLRFALYVPQCRLTLATLTNI